jgi:hypothetical protein
MFNWIDRLFNEHKFARRFALFWCMGTVTLVAVRVTNPDVMPLVSTAVASVLVALVGLCGTVMAFYEKHRGQDDVKK